ncbi:hypothetical protein SCP_0607310 [Sparassis crispa]|uniref:Uncharacterized protein n=1 Tax=Sparassis crispa TaxID=139825 RepID=A0A401GR71_9APHY|nr:hypothetical protein SCP_0607310 [Sparassis crispa]GBE84751.1 hypothetical protein SCP_0607310 [Sparassis crispa]
MGVKFAAQLIDDKSGPFVDVEQMVILTSQSMIQPAMTRHVFSDATRVSRRRNRGEETEEASAN